MVKFVKPERREQADDSLGDLVSRLDERGVLGSGEIPRGIETAADLFQVPLASQPREIRSGNAEFLGIFGPYDLAFRRQPAELFGFRVLHDALGNSVPNPRQM